VLIREANKKNQELNPWNVKFLRMFDMANDSNLFRTREELEATGGKLVGNVFINDNDKYLPLYEAKMIWHYDHRWASYDGMETRDLTLQEKSNPNFVVKGRYWINEKEVDLLLHNIDWHRKWLIGFRDITNVTNERTVVTSLMPCTAVGHTCPLLLSKKETNFLALLSSSLNSYVLDFFSRQKIGGTHLTYGYFNQLPILPPDIYYTPCLWDMNTTSYSTWALYRAIELMYTAWDLEPFAKDCGFDGPPFRWDEERRFKIRCELDAAYFHLYLGDTQKWRAEGTPELLGYFPTPRQAVEYVMETFPIVKRKDIAKHGSYRTKELILEIYDAMAEAIRTGKPYQTILDPPPGPPTHPDGTFAALPNWPAGAPKPKDWPMHIHEPRKE